MLSFLQYLNETIKYDSPKKPKKTGNPIQDKNNELRNIEKLRTIQMKKLATNVPDMSKRIQKQKELEYKTKMLKHQKGLI